MTEKQNISGMRISYDKSQLLENDLANNPLDQFNIWLEEVVALGPSVVIEPNAMVLATSDKHGVVTSRSVLLKGIDERGLSFYTNYGSRKAQGMEANPNVSVTFPWYPLHRQISVVGSVTKLSRDESEEYFRSRPHKSQLGALASNQSEEITSRAVVEDVMAELEVKYPEGTTVPMPDFWGGYLITVHSMEFWQGRQSRLHDRLRFIKTGTDTDLSASRAWKVIRVSP
ncbi:MAG: pyridoxamine 5-phosphate oxidase [Actinomycetota bacterium]|jgi:pyridoxamine 5'-phosphate oxidase